MKTIYKYQPDFREVGATFRIDLPFCAEVIAAGVQGGKHTFWAMVYPDQLLPNEHRWFVIYGTGFPINPALHLEHISTYQDGPFVWHMFEIKNCP